MMLPVDVLCKGCGLPHVKFIRVEVGGQLLQDHLHQSLELHPQEHSLYLLCGKGGTILCDAVGNANQGQLVFLGLQML